nr:MAG: hypothetical protein AM324_08870 [Candidatus Thorarchaeota archaeon SMTZ1-83]
MGRSKGKIISIKIPIRWGMMTNRQRTRINRITGRDTRVIKAYLGVIERHEDELLTTRRRNRIDARKLDELTLTASFGSAYRTRVPHDFKQRFPNISVNELQECRDTAIAMWQSYLERGGTKPLNSRSYTSRKIPRFAFRQRFELVYAAKNKIRYWLVIRDSLDSSRQGRRIHDKLSIPLSPSSYHLKRKEEGEIRTVRLFKDRSRKWWAIFTLTLGIQLLDFSRKPPAVLAIDLGINKTACTVLLTRNGYRQVRFWKEKKKLVRMIQYDNRVSSLQREMERLHRVGTDTSGIKRRLRDIGNKRKRVSIEYDRKVVKNISDQVMELTKDYDLYISIGLLRGIRNRARKGNYAGRGFRGMIHRWSFYRVREMLKHKLETLGFDSKRFVAVHESWTSVKCHKCGHTGIRPKQSLFICHTCGFRANADLNGAINIGRRLIMLIPSLRDEKNGLGMWLLQKEKAAPKARRSLCSKGKSSLPQRLPASLEGESVVDCYDQTSLEESVSSKDPATARTVETSSAFRTTGVPVRMQRTEAQFRLRNNVSVKPDEAHVIVSDSHLTQAGDGSREKGGTQEFLDGSLSNARNRSS